jgi:hypothetical protein
MEWFLILAALLGASPAAAQTKWVAPDSCMDLPSAEAQWKCQNPPEAAALLASCKGFRASLSSMQSLNRFANSKYYGAVIEGYERSDEVAKCRAFGFW